MTANRLANDIKMRIQQLGFMAGQLEEVYDRDESIKFQLGNVKELLAVESIYPAAETLQKIITDRDLLQENARAHKIIIENTRKMAYLYIMKLSDYQILGKFN